MPILAAILLSCFIAFSHWSLDVVKQQETSYTREQVAALDALLLKVGAGEPDDAPSKPVKPVKLWTPRNERERGLMIAKIWNIEGVR